MLLTAERDWGGSAEVGGVSEGCCGHGWGFLLDGVCSAGLALYPAWSSSNLTLVEITGRFKL